MTSHKVHTRCLALSVITMALAACNHDDNTAFTNPGIPTGKPGTLLIKEPVLTGTNIAVVDGDIPTTNDTKNTVALDPNSNPIIQILNGFNDIWYAGDDTWASNGSDTLNAVNGNSGVSGGGSTSTTLAIPFNFSNDVIRDMNIWKENFDYVTTLTRPGQSKPDVDRNNKAAMVFAYLDDQRDKGFSLNDGLGPLTEDYRSGANSHSSYGTDSNNDVTLTDNSNNVTTVDVTSATYNKSLNEKIASHIQTGYGTTTDGGNATELSNVVDLLNAIASHGASSQAPKYHFASPRPWRISKDDYDVASFNDPSASIYSQINDLTKLDRVTCLNPDGTTDTDKYYERPANPIVTPMSGLICAARTTYRAKSGGGYSEGYDFNASPLASETFSSRAKDGAFPSGHTAEAFDRGLGYAYAIPERFAEMVARAGDLGQNRIVAGMHSPLDVIGGRIMATAITAATLTDPNNATVASNAYNQANSYFTAKATAAGYDNIYDYAHCTTDAENPCSKTDRYADHTAMKARYKAYMTYGFSPLNEPKIDPEVPKGAEALLATRFPYLDDNQRRAVLATTEIDSNYPVINKSRGWGRLNLVDAADGYGAFDVNTTIFMDAAKGGFNAEDHWWNDISGAGRLTKSGTGSLYLQGNNTYRGGTIVNAGFLVGTSATAFGSNTLYQQGGTVGVSIKAGASDQTQGVLTVSDFVQTTGKLELNLNNNARLNASNGIYLTGTSNQLVLDIPTLTTATTYTILSSNHLEGTFETVTATDNNGKAYDVSINYSSTGATVTVSPRA
ncbi:Extracellular serine protease precursor [Vibrio ruber DSM 16370]|uniref:Extracellular serine protease n=1 Tax=Vibrio ruber (strain DSM 16370 / JCM 11486 / BCRC 17186 / CECT 7878 / LMG 23124 / VR1) TaxID=1123498 RepID=A0A1R4LLD4_VIBR1|nr:phosphatase PAP2 family protein [Vibrio ruber]SJN57187.1 Extracellular serine protease precursor [Vibrio ruber DSM 16370]